MFDIVYQMPGARKKHVSVKTEKCTIGSGRHNDIVIANKHVAKQHAVLYKDPVGIKIDDLGTMTGTWINRERVISHGPISEMDEVVIGTTRLWVSSKIVDSEPVVLGKKVELKAEQPQNSSSDSTSLAVSGDTKKIEEFQYWSKLVHTHLLQEMDLRRKDVHSMTDQQLKHETEQLLSRIMQKLSRDIPSTIDQTELRQSVMNEAVGLGPLEKFLDDESITEIMVNNQNEIFIEQAGRLTKSQFRFSSSNAVLSVIERIITPIGRRIDESSPMVDARLKDGSRVNAIIPPLALKGPSLTIRKFSKKRLLPNDLIKFQSVNDDMVEFMKICVHNRKNIIVSGGTGSGKTTLLNVLSNFIPDTERIITVEDAAELKLTQPNLVTLEARPANIEGRGLVTIRDLVKNTLRMRPDRIVVGECRGGEALDMLQAMNTGHDGSLTTAHANSARDVLSRLEVMVLMAGMELPVSAIREQISSAVDVIVQQTRFPCGSRKVTSITEVVGIESGTIQLQDIFVYKQRGFDKEGKVKGEFMATGFVPSFYEELAEMGYQTNLEIFKQKYH
jgi:pilus assembly protein CpaF